MPKFKIRRILNPVERNQQALLCSLERSPPPRTRPIFFEKECPARKAADDIIKAIMAAPKKAKHIDKIRVKLRNSPSNNTLGSKLENYRLAPKKSSAFIKL